MKEIKNKRKTFVILIRKNVYSFIQNSIGMSLCKHVYATHICRLTQKQLYNVLLLPMKKLYLELDILAQLIFYTSQNGVSFNART